MISARKNVFQVQKHPAHSTEMQKFAEIKNIPYLLPVVYINFFIRESVGPPVDGMVSGEQFDFELQAEISHANTLCYRDAYWFSWSVFI